MTPRQSRPERITPVVLPARPGDETETVIERIVPGGFGLGFGGGRTLFVSRAAPGDRLRVRIDREHGRVAHASIVEILEPGPDRVAEAYPLLSRCGADFQHLRYDAQLAAKSGMIADSLRRIGGINLPDPIHVAPSPVVWEYRARAEWRHDPNQPALGYLNRDRRTRSPGGPLRRPRACRSVRELRAGSAGRMPEWATELRAPPATTASLRAAVRAPTTAAGPRDSRRRAVRVRRRLLFSGQPIRARRADVEGSAAPGSGAPSRLSLAIDLLWRGLSQFLPPRRSSHRGRRTAARCRVCNA
jgi:predicted RNA-binding protein with TRAM domain